MRDLRSGPARLLVVDDNKVNRLLLTRGLELQGHSVASAENGRIALEMLRREGFDLLLLDMEMPEMDGFQVLEQLGNDRQLRDLPVIVTSSLEGVENVVRCIELGAEDYLSKPVNPGLLKARIGASLEKKRLRDQQKELMRRFATPEVAQDLQTSGFSLGGKLVNASVMFSDIRGFTSLAESQPPEETIELLNTYYELMFDAISGHGGVVTLMMGDGLMSVFGAPVPLPDHGESAVRAAQEMVELIELFNVEREAAQKPPIRIGIGIASGEMVAGYTGTTKRATYTCIGDTVNLAARLETHTKVAQRVILIDQATRSSLSERIAVEPLGPVPFKGKAAAVEVFSVDPGQKR
ncbi:MAG TPA: adenylate/guanylate cyclase domain-containing response regulator [Casimicrobiaceae bacterium]|jgi:class 3 adenylate cyclase|nr:adenylate/guanylate cyclase domain-containing response regulator [Casimicrobiaceae bacterium]